MDENEKQKKQIEKEEFVKGLRVHVEGLFGGENKPSIEDVNKEDVIREFKERIEKFSQQNGLAKEVVINFALDIINQVRKINPESKEQYNLIEESLYEVLYEGQDFDDETFDL